MKEIIEYVSYVILGISIVTSVLTFILNSLKIKKAKSTSTEEMEELKSQVDISKSINEIVTKIVPNAMIFAEQNGATGTIKKVLALSQTLLECANEDIDFKSNKDLITNTIEDIIKLTKEINYKKETKVVDTTTMVGNDNGISNNY